MTGNKSSKSKHKSSSIIKRIGITKIIPIFLAMCGALIIFSSLWNYVSSRFDYSSIFFEQSDSSNQADKKVYNINGSNITKPNLGDEFARISIPSVGIDKPVFEGDDDKTLKKGIGHYQGSLLPGQGGNFVIAGHRDTDFLPLQDIKKGDDIIVATSYGKYYYKVSSIDIVNPTDVYVAAPTKYEKITMITCYPFNYFGSAPQRYIVSGDFVKVE